MAQALDQIEVLRLVVLQILPIVQERLGTNPELIRRQAPLADFTMAGTLDRSEQISQFLQFFSRYFGGGAKSLSGGTA